MNKIFGYLLTLVVFLVLDFAWIGAIAKKFYREHLGFIMKKNPNWTAAIIFYLLYVFGVIFFAINPALKDVSWSKALLYGAVFGLVAYSTYDLTNMATLKDWPVKLTVIDIIWGSALTAMTATAGYFISGMLG